MFNLILQIFKVLWITMFLNGSWFWSHHLQTFSESWNTTKCNIFEWFLIPEATSADLLWKVEYCERQRFWTVPDYGANIRRLSLEAGILWNTMLLNDSWFWSQYLQSLAGSRASTRLPISRSSSYTILFWRFFVSHLLELRNHCRFIPPTNPSPATGQNPQEPRRNRVGTV